MKDLRLVLRGEGGDEVGGLDELLQSTGLERYGYERASLMLDGRLQLVARDDTELDVERVESYPQVVAWREKLHRDVTALRAPSEQRERLLRRPVFDNKETFLIEWRGERWYAQFYDNLVYLCRYAHVRPKVW